METRPRNPYPSVVSDEEWAFVAPYLTLMDEASPQRRHDLREVFNGPRHIVRTGLQWRQMPHDLLPWPAVYQQTCRQLAAGTFEALVHPLRVPLPRRWVIERNVAWASRFRRLARAYERLPETFAGLHSVAFACPMLRRLVTVVAKTITGSKGNGRKAP